MKYHHVESFGIIDMVDMKSRQYTKLNSFQVMNSARLSKLKSYFNTGKKGLEPSI